MYRRSGHCTTAPTPSFAAPCTTSHCASATRRTRCPTSDSSPAPILQRRPRFPGSGAARPPLSASKISRRQGPRRPAEYTSPHSNQQTRAGNRFPLARRQGFLHVPATRPTRNRRAPARLDLYVSDLEAWGVPCRGNITATSQAKLSTPPPPRHYCACVGANSSVFLCFPTVNPPS
jgi:hypothetical protein